MNKSVSFIKDSIMAGQPIIQIVSYEEKRVESTLKKIAQQVFKQPNVYQWDVHNGLAKDGQPVPETHNPISALDFVQKNSEPAIYIFKDLNPYLRNSPELVRKLRECFFLLKNSRRVILLLSPDDFFHTMLKKEIDLVHYDLPDVEELENLFNKFLETFTKSGTAVNLTADQKKNFVIAAQGLTLDEAYKAYMKTFQGQSQIGIELLDKIHEEKKQLILKEVVLEYVPQKYTIDDMGGLDRLKDWLMKRKKALTKEALAFGLDRPRGVLCMGITGCGKSLASKVIASLWNMPLFRLDMNLVYSGMAGSPEEVFARALKTMDALSPALLWIDEIESGISDKHTDSSSSRILGYFLTWMQEHTSDIFVAATANRIDMLPAELMRRGRFDQIFFIDLPTHREREDIFTIHLKKRGNDVPKFNIPQLAQITKGWSGSEIEQAIISAMYEAFNENRKLIEDDLFIIFGNTVPISTTMEEQIKRIRSWAHNRAVRASADKEY